MKFKLTTSGSFYSEPAKKALETLGFKFDPPTPGVGYSRWYMRYDPVSIEIKDLKELIEFVAKWGDVVLSKDALEIYDDYRE